MITAYLIVEGEAVEAAFSVDLVQFIGGSHGRPAPRDEFFTNWE